MTARWYSIRAAAAGAEVSIYDVIGGPDGISAKQFVKDLQKHASAKQLTIRINSPGGSVFDGVAIYNALARHKAHKTVWVDGFAASVASVIAMAGDEIVMPANTIMMIHEPYGAAIGTAADMRAMGEALDRAGDALVVAYRRSRQTDARIKQLLVAETWLDANEAFDLGFADRVVDPVKIAACADFGSFPYKHAPQPSPVDAWSKVIASKFPKLAG